MSIREIKLIIFERNQFRKELNESIFWRLPRAKKEIPKTKAAVLFAWAMVTQAPRERLVNFLKFPLVMYVLWIFSLSQTRQPGLSLPSHTPQIKRGSLQFKWGGGYESLVADFILTSTNLIATAHRSIIRAIGGGQLWYLPNSMQFVAIRVIVPWSSSHM